MTKSLLYAPVGFRSWGIYGGLAGNGAVTLRNIGWPKPCISQLEGTSMSLHFLVLNLSEKKSLGIPSGVSA